MTSLIDQTSQGIIKAMKAQNKTELNALRYLKKLLIENNTSKKPIDEMDVLIGYAKKLKDSIELYPEGSQQRIDLKAEIAVFDRFLPSQLTEAEVLGFINDIKSKLEAPNMGVIMKELNPLIKGRFDGKLASDMVKNSL